MLFPPGSGSVEGVNTERADIAVIGAGPAGAATAIQAARSGAKVVVFEKGAHGRDKVFFPGLGSWNNKDFQDEWKTVDERGRLIIQR